MDESFGSDRVGGPNGKFLGAVEDGHVASFEERGLPPDLMHHLTKTLTKIQQAPPRLLKRPFQLIS